jgi:hypothetical protein
MQFPSDVEINRREVEEFRGRTPAERMRAIRGLLAAGALLMRRSPPAAFMREYTEEQENRARQAVKKCLARHGG